MKRFLRRTLPCVIGLVLMLGVVAGRAQPILTMIQSNGPTSKYINLVYLSEGYVQAELPQFLVDTTNVASQLLALPPWNAYSNYFNVFAISVFSNQSGSDHYTPSISLVDTYFNSSFDSHGIQRSLTIPPNDKDSNANNGRNRVYALLQQLLPEYDIVTLLVNDPMYGGSGGGLSVSSMNGAAPEIANHEIGHSFAALGDEYSDPNPEGDNLEQANTTTLGPRQLTRDFVKWKSWIDLATLIPTPDVPSNNAVVGLFEGANYQTTGWYRPMHDCKMRSLYVPYCAVCAQEIVLAIYRTIRPIQQRWPATTNFVIGPTDSVAFNIAILQPMTNSLTVQWFTNGVAVPGANSINLLIAASELRPGSNQVRVVVHDPTGFVRNDPQKRLWETNTWTIGITGPPLINNPSLNGSTFTLSALTLGGLKYVLESKDSFTDTGWTAIRTNTGTGGDVTFTNLGAPPAGRLYRLRVQ